MKEVYVIIKASNCNLANATAYTNKDDANRKCEILCKAGCNPNSYFVDTLFVEE